MVEPVFGFCTEQEHRNFLRGVVGFEKDLVRQGTILVKLYFSVTKDEQARRFERRKHDPLRQWKLSEIDVQAQEHWDDFTDMKYTMLKRTSTADAPWTDHPLRGQAPGPAQRHAGDLERRALRDRAAEVDFVPDPAIVLSGAQELALMEADRIRQRELVKLQEWVRTRAQGVRPVRGPRRRRQGRRHQAHHRAHQPARRAGGGARRPPSASAPSGTSSATWPTSRGGEIVLFDRSWYNRAGVERVMGFCTEDEYRRVPPPAPTSSAC
jgi:hypothetical protein